MCKDINIIQKMFTIQSPYSEFRNAIFVMAQAIPIRLDVFMRCGSETDFKPSALKLISTAEVRKRNLIFAGDSPHLLLYLNIQDAVRESFLTSLTLCDHLSLYLNILGFGSL